MYFPVQKVPSNMISMTKSRYRSNSYHKMPKKRKRNLLKMWNENIKTTSTQAMCTNFFVEPPSKPKTTSFYYDFGPVAETTPSFDIQNESLLTKPSSTYTNRHKFNNNDQTTHFESSPFLYTENKTAARTSGQKYFDPKTKSFTSLNQIGSIRRYEHLSEKTNNHNFERNSSYKFDSTPLPLSTNQTYGDATGHTELHSVQRLGSTTESFFRKLFSVRKNRTKILKKSKSSLFSSSVDLPFKNLTKSTNEMTVKEIDQTPTEPTVENENIQLEYMNSTHSSNDSTAKAYTEAQNNKLKDFFKMFDSVIFNPLKSSTLNNGKTKHTQSSSTHSTNIEDSQDHTDFSDEQLNLPTEYQFTTNSSLGSLYTSRNIQSSLKMQHVTMNHEFIDNITENVKICNSSKTYNLIDVGNKSSSSNNVTNTFSNNFKVLNGYNNSKSKTFAFHILKRFRSKAVFEEPVTEAKISSQLGPPSTETYQAKISLSCQTTRSRDILNKYTTEREISSKLVNNKEDSKGQRNESLFNQFCNGTTEIVRLRSTIVENNTSEAGFMKQEDVTEDGIENPENNITKIENKSKFKNFFHINKKPTLGVVSGNSFDTGNTETNKLLTTEEVAETTEIYLTDECNSLNLEEMEEFLFIRTTKSYALMNQTKTWYNGVFLKTPTPKTERPSFSDCNSSNTNPFNWCLNQVQLNFTEKYLDPSDSNGFTTAHTRFTPNHTASLSTPPTKNTFYKKTKNASTSKLKPTSIELVELNSTFRSQLNSINKTFQSSSKSSESTTVSMASNTFTNELASSTENTNKSESSPSVQKPKVAVRFNKSNLNTKFNLRHFGSFLHNLSYKTNSTLILNPMDVYQMDCNKSVPDLNISRCNQTGNVNGSDSSSGTTSSIWAYVMKPLDSFMNVFKGDSPNNMTNVGEINTSMTSGDENLPSNFHPPNSSLIFLAMNSTGNNSKEIHETRLGLWDVVGGWFHCFLESYTEPRPEDMHFYLYTRNNTEIPEELYLAKDYAGENSQDSNATDEHLPDPVLEQEPTYKTVKKKRNAYDDDDYEEGFEPLNPAESKLDSRWFNIRKDTKILIHGYRQNNLTDIIIAMKDAYLNKSEVNVIVVDWSVVGDNVCYPTVAEHGLQSAGLLLARLLDQLVGGGVALSKVHLVGFSLGAHVAGRAGNETKHGLVSRITGLDPALPYIPMEAAVSLDVGDAVFVDIIHSAAGYLGQPGPMGHVDFYPNGGSQQPGCDISSLGGCSHRRSALYFIESIGSEVGFQATACDSWLSFQAGLCENSSTLLMGDTCPASASGKYFLSTGNKEPFALVPKEHNKVKKSLILDMIY